MRNMSFMLTTAQIRNRTKTVIRRNGWWFLKPGDVLNAVEKSQGLKKGEKIKHICQIRILSVRRENLHFITESECILEGFPGMSRNEFITMFCRSHKGVTPETIINRIEFEFI
jgi:hypothetical protein